MTLSALCNTLKVIIWKLLMTEIKIRGLAYYWPHFPFVRVGGTIKMKATATSMLSMTAGGIICEMPISKIIQTGNDSGSSNQKAWKSARICRIRKHTCIEKAKIGTLCF